MDLKSKKKLASGRQETGSSGSSKESHDRDPMTFLADDSKQVSPVLIPSPLGDEKFLGKNGFEGRY